MPLTFTGKFLKTLNTTNYRALGSDGALIVVEASDEAVDDFGENTVQAKARDKYDAGDISNNIITVKPTDFA
jgi:hypothetical protein